MAYITFDDYKQLGYTVVPEEQFRRFQAKAEMVVRRRTQNRIASMKVPEPEVGDSTRRWADIARIAEMNQRGMCELIDLYFLADNPQSEAAKARQVITGFTNQGYGESYMGEARTDVGLVAPERFTVDDIIANFFTPDQRWLGTSRC